jgi:hypothetical protein
MSTVHREKEGQNIKTTALLYVQSLCVHRSHSIRTDHIKQKLTFQSGEGKGISLQKCHPYSLPDMPLR